MTAVAAAVHEAPRRPIKARRTGFDLSATPRVWIPGDPQTTHLMDSLHVVLPPGERWFCKVYRDALPELTDPQLREDVKGFIGQEATHARAHDLGLEHLRRHGIDLVEDVAWIDRTIDRLRARVARLPRPVRRWVLRHELAAIAAIEHFTAVLGVWIVEASALDAAGVDPAMLDLLRWHGAEEVEHRSVAFDVYQALDGGHRKRALHGIVLAVVVNLGLVGVGMRVHRLDPARRQAKARVFRWRSYKAAVAAGHLPDMVQVALSIREFLRRDYHPSHYGTASVPGALAYLASSPGVLARVR